MKSIGDNLKLFRLRCNLSLTDAGSKVRLSAPGLLKYERNKVNHSLDKLNKLADIYNVTLDDILRVDDTASIKFTNLRVGTSVSEAKIEKIKSLIQNKVDNYFELLNKSNIKLVNKFGVHIINTVNEAESLATKLRIFFQIPINEPIYNLIYLLEQHDIIVLTLDKSSVTEGFIGFYENINNIPVIIVPKEDDGYSQRFNVAKFLGELLIISNESNKSNLTDTFALSLLVPTKSLINEFGENRKKINFEEIDIFSKVYRVSYKNIIKKLEISNIITSSNAKYLNIYINKENKKEQYFMEEALNYNKMLYKLNALDIISDVSSYL